MTLLRGEVPPMRLSRSGGMAFSTREGHCSKCHRRGFISDWPGNDPANAKATVTVLCVFAHGELLCDDCASKQSADDPYKEWP